MIEITVFGRVLFSINVTFSAYHLGPSIIISLLLTVFCVRASVFVRITDSVSYLN